MAASPIKWTVDKASGCWLFAGGLVRGGYGQVRLGAKKILAHRAAWELVNGPIPAGLLVCHNCDTPACVNPAHLFLGTPRENMADKIAKGRQRNVTGEAHGRAKLTEQMVQSIISDSRTQREIAKAFGIGQAQVSRIKTGSRWAAKGESS